MKRILFIILVLGLSFSINAQPPAGEAKPGDWYGEKTSVEGAIDIAALPAQLTDTFSVPTKIKGKIIDVCPKKGCWLSLQVNDSTTAFVKMKDYAFFLPLAAIGKTVVLEGDAQVKTTSVERLKHYAEDAKKSKAEVDAITQPKKEINLLAKGIVIVE